MSFNLNRVMLAGHLTRDPELRQVGPDNTVANFGIAVNRQWKNKAGEKQEEVTFVDLEVWGKLADLCGQYITKGRPIYCEGRLKLDQWEDKDGSKRSKLKVVADVVQFLGEKPQQEQSGPIAHHAAKPVDTQKKRAEPMGGGYGSDDSQPPFLKFTSADSWG